LNKRRSEASALRAFFQEHWDHLQHLLATREREKQAKEIDRSAISDAVEAIVDGTDPRLRGLSRYQQSLREGARALLDIVDNMVAEMPPPLRIDRRALITNPHLKTLFPRPDIVQELFSNNRNIHQFIKKRENRDCKLVFLLLFMSFREKTILGSEIRDGQMVRDVLQTTVQFSGHFVTAPSRDEASVRFEMKRVLFESVIDHLKIVIAHIKHDEMEEERKSKIYNPLASLKNPEVYLEMLLKQMKLPQSLIRMEENLLRIDRMGIKVIDDEHDAAKEIRLKTLTLGEERPRLVSLVSFPVDELSNSLEGGIF
jgi:hypothetical protein